MTAYHAGRGPRHRHRLGLDYEEKRYTRKISDRVLMARLLSYLLKYKRRFIVTVAAVVAVSLTGLLPPYLLQVAVDSYMANGDLTGLTFISVILVGIYLVNWISNYQRTYQMSWMGQNMVNEMRTQLFSHLQELSFSFYHNQFCQRIYMMAVPILLFRLRSHLLQPNRQNYHTRHHSPNHIQDNPRHLRHRNSCLLLYKCCHFDL